jgi:hypothetical protein
LAFYDTDEITLERIQPQSFFDMLRPSFVQRMINEQVKVLFEVTKNDEDAIIATGAILPSDGGCADILPMLGAVIHIKRSVDNARADALQSDGITMVRVGRDGEAIEGSEINMSAKAVDAYASDLPLLERISGFTVENDDGISIGVDRLVSLIKFIDESSKNEGKDETH